jgi:hypothetical protein
MSTINSAEDLPVDLQKGERYTCDVPYIHFAAYSIPKFHLAAHTASCDWLTGCASPLLITVLPLLNFDSKSLVL